MAKIRKAFWEYFVKDTPKNEEDDSQGGKAGGSSGGSGRRKPPGGDAFPTTYLVEETEQMQYERRGLEQVVERQLATVEERRKPKRDYNNEGPGQQEQIKQHPLLDSQRFDGIDPSLNPAPFGNEQAVIDFENERREQDKEKQLRLGNMPKMGNSYVPELKR